MVGDLIADQFVFGAISRVSREAPVFILRHEETQTVAGGAANCAVNVASLGANAVLIGVLGKDIAGNALLEQLEKSQVTTSHLIISNNWQTTTKVRIFAGQTHAPRQQVIRLDYENETKINAEIEAEIIEKLKTATEDADAIVISDYNYGVAGEKLAKMALEVSRKKKIPLLVDSRYHLRNFAGATSATPNEDEVEQILEKSFSDENEFTEACIKLRAQLDYQALLVTRGNDGMLLIEKDKKPLAIEVVGSRDPVDVTGAGDTVMATYALALASGATFAEAAKLANHAGGIVVMKRGTASVSPEEMQNSLAFDINAPTEGKRSGNKL